MIMRKKDNRCLKTVKMQAKSWLQHCKSTKTKFSRMADEVVVLESPANFYAVAQVYEHWCDVSNEEALEIFRRQK